MVRTVGKLHSKYHILLVLGHLKPGEALLLLWRGSPLTRRLLVKNYLGYFRLFYEEQTFSQGPPLRVSIASIEDIQRWRCILLPSNDKPSKVTTVAPVNEESLSTQESSGDETVPEKTSTKEQVSLEVIRARTSIHRQQIEITASYRHKDAPQIVESLTKLEALIGDLLALNRFSVSKFLIQVDYYVFKMQNNEIFDTSDRIGGKLPPRTLHFKVINTEEKIMVPITPTLKTLYTSGKAHTVEFRTQGYGLFELGGGLEFNKYQSESIIIINLEEVPPVIEGARLSELRLSITRTATLGHIILLGTKCGDWLRRNVDIFKLSTVSFKGIFLSDIELFKDNEFVSANNDVLSKVIPSFPGQNMTYTLKKATDMDTLVSNTKWKEPVASLTLINEIQAEEDISKVEFQDGTMNVTRIQLKAFTRIGDVQSVLRRLRGLEALETQMTEGINSVLQQQSLREIRLTKGSSGILQDEIALGFDYDRVRVLDLSEAGKVNISFLRLFTNLRELGWQVKESERVIETLETMRKLRKVKLNFKCKFSSRGYLEMQHATIEDVVNRLSQIHCFDLKGQQEIMTEVIEDVLAKRVWALDLRVSKKLMEIDDELVRRLLAICPQHTISNY